MARWPKLLLELGMDSRNTHLVDRMAVTSVHRHDNVILFIPKLQYCMHK